MLTECRQLIACCEDTPIHAWTESRLLTFLSNLLRQTQVDVAICIFVDGLDEFDGHYDSVIKMITELSDQSHVKICVSSRPLLAFEMAFKGKPSIRLQDLTFDTIREYADKQLSHLVQQHASSNDQTQQRAESLLQIIVQRAEGVFLWAVIATKQVRDGLQGMVNLDELAQAIEILPPELEDLFMLVLKRIKLPFRRDAAKFLQILLFMDDDDDDLDLCRLHLISSQQEFQDAPFVYENIAMSELTEACRTLRIRLLSHTAGFLELTQTSASAPAYCKRKDWDPISFTRVEFIHRTVQDFLIDNEEAKSFLREYGFSEAQVHLFIARGTLAHLTQHSEGDTVESLDRCPHPMLFPFQDVLRHVSVAERLSGGAQSKFIQSLDYASLVRGCRVTKYPFRLDGDYQAFWKNAAGTLVDIVGMAAAEGMKIFVCEQLGLSVSSAGYYPSLPDLEKYTTSRAAPPTLSWKTLDQLPDITHYGDKLVHCSSSRQALSKCLQWEEDTVASLRPDGQTEDYSLVDNYILCCCEPTSIDLVRILLKTGANPMARVRSMRSEFSRGLSVSNSFWGSWLELLWEKHHEYVEANDKSGGLFGKDHLHRHLTLSDIFDVTKALLAHGADINHQMREEFYLTFLQRRSLANPVRPLMSCSAMFLLEERFKKEPEFREFAVAVSPLIETPTRRIRYLQGPGKQISLSSADESKLWPFIEKWESTGHENDRFALVTALEQIWKALESDVELEETWEFD